LDGSGVADSSTGIPFLDHMLHFSTFSFKWFVIPFFGDIYFCYIIIFFNDIDTRYDMNTGTDI
jgi:hypothetical protein